MKTNGIKKKILNLFKRTTAVVLTAAMLLQTININNNAVYAEEISSNQTTTEQDNTQTEGSTDTEQTQRKAVQIMNRVRQLRKKIYMRIL